VIREDQEHQRDEDEEEEEIGNDGVVSGIRVGEQVKSGVKSIMKQA